MRKVSPPTEKQIVFAEQISNTLNRPFPISSKEYTKSAFSTFISNNILEYRLTASYDWFDEEDLHDLGLYENDAWCEHY